MRRCWTRSKERATPDFTTHGEFHRALFWTFCESQDHVIPSWETAPCNPVMRPKKVFRTVQGRSIPEGLLRRRCLRWRGHEEVDWLVLGLVFAVWGADKACALPRSTFAPSWQHSVTTLRTMRFFLHSVTKSEQVAGFATGWGFLLWVEQRFSAAFMCF